MRKIKTIIRKEWAQVYKNRMVVFSIILMPLLFTAIPLVTMGVTKGVGADSLAATEIPEQFAAICPADMTGGECFRYYLVSSFMLMFMMTPLIIPVQIAAFSIVGEKTTRSLEPLLATPITTLELLAGKNLAATIPAVLATWLGFVLFVIGTAVIGTSWRLVGALLDPLWLVAVFVVGPLLAVLSVNFSIMVSSRVSDPRVAEQLSALVIMPLLLLFFGQMTGFLIINRAIVLVMAAVLVVLDAVLIYLAVRMFEREAILSRWR
jgi:ABC-2 type transport system permease protein